MKITAYMSISYGRSVKAPFRLNYPERLLNLAKLRSESDSSVLSSMLSNLEKYRRELVDANPSLSIINVIVNVDSSVESELPF